MKKLILAIFVLALSYIAYSQNNEGKADDYSRIALNTYVPNISGMPEAAKNMLKNKIDQVATLSGRGGNAINPRFVITANVTVLSKDITATAPPMIALSIEVTFFVGDAQTMTKYSSATIDAKGIGTNETKAYIEAIKTIRTTAPELKVMVETGKKKIVEYYNSQCDFILKKADALDGQTKYGEAIFTLTQIPDVCKECYAKAMDATVPIYKKFADQNCLQKLNAAKAAWAGAQNSDGAAKAAEFLKGIDPQASCMPDVNSFIAEVNAKIKELDQRDWDFKMKVFDASVDIQKQQIEEARQVGVAFGENQQQGETLNLDSWFK
jgi:riboflavin synthase